MKWIPWSLLLFVSLAILPFVPQAAEFIREFNFGSALPNILIFGILALGLNVVIGNAGQLHLGIAAFFGIGAFTMAIARVSYYPFQLGFWQGLIVATLISALIGMALAAPTLRLRGDYLALVTLGFGVITITLLRKFDEVTGGKQTLNQIPPPQLPEFLREPLGVLTNESPLQWLGLSADWSADYRLFYLMMLGFLGAIYWMLRNIERSRLGRAWLAIREDELAATCMGINAARLKLGAFTLGAALAGLAGGLFVTKMETTNEPTAYDFQLSVMVLSAVILGGLANRNGVLIGVFLILGFEYLLSPAVDSWIQHKKWNPEGKNYLRFSNWKLMIFGLALILTMRFRPRGILPERRTRGV
jgi:branched-chain amino acid transport system permease protein